MNRSELLIRLIESAKKHRELDDYKKGFYFENGKGCAVGCAIRDIQVIEGVDEIAYDDHEFLSEKLGVPLFICLMQDSIFENCTTDYRKDWPVRFLESIKPDADHSLLMPKFLLFVLKDMECEHVKNVLRNWITTGSVDDAAAAVAADDAAAAVAAVAADDAAAAAVAAVAAARAAAVAAARAAYVDRDSTYAARYIARAVQEVAYAARASTHAAAYNSFGEEIIKLLGETA